MRVLDANGPGAPKFAERARNLVTLAQTQNEPDAARALSSLALLAARGRDSDVRQALYDGLDRAHAALRAVH